MGEYHQEYSLSNPNDENINFIESLSNFDQTFETLTAEPESHYVQDELEFFGDVLLPIHQYKDEIVSTIRNNKCIVLTGATGCGKTTQVPQFIIQDCIANNEPYNVLITQPRKIAAITNASRVAQETNSLLGASVGYQISLQRVVNCAGKRTKLLYCTTGVILQKLIRSQSMQMYTHIILDEIHERDIEMDFLLILMRQLLYTNSPNTKVILMSATMDAAHFADYFSSYHSRYFKVQTLVIPIINVQAPRKFPIKTFFLDDLNMNMSPEIIDTTNPGIKEEMMNLASEIIFQHVQNDDESSILVFLPGFYEIENFEQALLQKFDVLRNFQIVILHSAVTPDDQKLAFKRDQKPKIILSTNIAENSVTIPKVNVIIDFCLTKYLVAVEGSNMASLKLNWTSKMSGEQRAGRTGRVCAGTVYHLVEKYFYDSMQRFTTPEMQRVPLERVVLKTKLLTNESPMEFLSCSLDPPHAENIRSSVLVLKELGALLRCDVKGDFQDDDGELTYCGRIMAHLPCDVYIGKFIVLGHVFSVLEEVVIIGAGLNINGSIFRYDHKKKLEAYSQRLNWCDGSGSDLQAILNAYRMWRYNLRNQSFKTAAMEEMWYEKFRLNRKNLYEMKELIEETLVRLEENRIRIFVGSDFPAVLEDKEKAMMVKTCVAGAWFPFYFLQQLPTESAERVAYRTIDNLDPRRTVFFRDPECNYNKLYNDIIKRALVDRGICDRVEDVAITYEQDRTKICVTFNRPTILDNKRDSQGIRLVDGTIMAEVYVAVKQKELSRGNFKLNVMDKRSIRDYANQIGYVDPSMDESITASSCTIGLHLMEGIITHVEHIDKFFFQPTGPSYDKDNHTMEFRLKMAKLLPIQKEMELSNGDDVVIRYQGKLQRGSVIKSAASDEPIKFNLIDLGIITQDVPLGDVHHSPKSLKQCFETPPRCFQCKLSELRPSYMTCPRGVYTDDANDFFRQLVLGQKVSISIYSVVNDVVSCVVKVKKTNINELMIQEEFALKADEDYNSRLNHSERQSHNLSFSSSSVTSDGSSVKPQPKRMLLEPPPGMSNMVLNLCGPHSPLASQLFGVLNIENPDIKIDANSVNSVVLNGDISGFSTRLYVAANVTRNRSEGITLRELTMLPKINGLAEILALIFTPQMILRRSDDLTRYTKLQTGLGCDPITRQAFFPLHDASFPITIDITDKDFQNINELRFSMSELLHVPPNVHYPPLTDGQKYSLQKRIKSLTNEILTTERDVVEPSQKPVKYSWAVDENESFDMVRRTDPLGARSIYGFHDYVKLHPVSKKKIEAKKRNLRDLQKFIECGNESFTADLGCASCETAFNSKRELSDHLMSPLHLKMIHRTYGVKSSKTPETSLYDL